MCGLNEVKGMELIMENKNILNINRNDYIEYKGDNY